MLFINQKFPFIIANPKLFQNASHPVAELQVYNKKVF